MIRPKLENYKAPSKLSEYPEATCFQAGHLVTKNAGWRNKRPVIDANKCVGCLQCYLYCPDGVISKVHKERLEKPINIEAIAKENTTNETKLAAVQIDYDFCKGCGICANICKLKAIRMEEEGNE